MDSVAETTLATVNYTQAIDPTEIFGPQRDSLFLVIPITIIYSLIFIIGLLGNIFTCIVIIRNKSMHTATNYYLFSLAISDLLLLVSGMPQEMYSIWSKWPYVFGNTFCVLRGLAAETSTNASVLTITLFTIERHLAICHPFVSHTMSKLSRATKHVLLLWVVALAFALPLAMQFGVRKTNGVVMCLQIRVIIQHSFEISTFLFFLTPMVLITMLYSLIGLKLRETSVGNENGQKEFDKNSSYIYTHKIRRKHSQSSRRVIKMLVAVVIAFFVCWAPFHAQRLVAIYGTTENHHARSPILLSAYYYLTYISGICYYLSTCINPVFYHIMSNKFRDAFKSTIKNWCCRRQMKEKRCSYTAMAVVRNPTSSGNSGNSLRNKPTVNYKTRRTSSRDMCGEHLHICSKDANTTSTKEDFISKKKFTVKGVKSPNEVRINVINEHCNRCNPQCSSSSCSSNSKERSSRTPEIIVGSDPPDSSDKCLKKLKLCVHKREKEYG